MNLGSVVEFWPAKGDFVNRKRPLPIEGKFVSKSISLRRIFKRHFIKLDKEY